MADFCLILYAFNTMKTSKAIRGNITVNQNEYTEIVHSDSGRVYLVKDVNCDELLSLL